MDDRKEGVLSRWSRLKREVAASKDTASEKEATDEMTAATQAEAGQTPMTVGETGPVASAVQAEINGIPQPTEDGIPAQAEEFPDIDTLTYESNFAVFLGKTVPAALQRKALAKLWRSDPVLANLDGLNDYQDDYRFIAEGDSPLRMLLEPESPAEMALEREQRLPRRSSLSESREQLGARPQVDAREKTNELEENASAEQAVELSAADASEGKLDET